MLNLIIADVRCSYCITLVLINLQQHMHCVAGCWDEFPNDIAYESANYGHSHTPFMGFYLFIFHPPTNCRLHLESNSSAKEFRKQSNMVTCLCMSLHISLYHHHLWWCHDHITVQNWWAFFFPCSLLICAVLTWYSWLVWNHHDIKYIHILITFYTSVFHSLWNAGTTCQLCWLLCNRTISLSR